MSAESLIYATHELYHCISDVYVPVGLPKVGPNLRRAPKVGEGHYGYLRAIFSRLLIATCNCKRK